MMHSPHIHTQRKKEGKKKKREGVTSRRRKKGRKKERKKEGRKEGEKEKGRRREGRKEGRKKEGGKAGWKEGRGKEGRKEGRKERRRNEGRKEGMLHYKLSAVLQLTLTHVSLGLTKHWPCLQTVCGALGGGWREGERTVTRRAICLIISCCGF